MFCSKSLHSFIKISNLLYNTQWSIYKASKSYLSNMTLYVVKYSVEDEECNFVIYGIMIKVNINDLVNQIMTTTIWCRRSKIY